MMTSGRHLCFMYMLCCQMCCICVFACERIFVLVYSEKPLARAQMGEQRFAGIGTFIHFLHVCNRRQNEEYV